CFFRVSYHPAGRPCETDVSAKSPTSPAHPWVPRAHADEKRPLGTETPAVEGAETARRFVNSAQPEYSTIEIRPRRPSRSFGPNAKLRTRAEFAAVQEQGRRIAMRYLIVLGCPNNRANDRL